MITQAKAQDIHDEVPKDKLLMQWNKDLPSGQADMTPKNNSRMINVLGVAMLLNTLNASALRRSSGSFYLQQTGCLKI